MTDDHLDDALEALGRAPVVAPTAEFADGLEQRLRAEHAERPSPAGGADTKGRRVAARVLAVAAVVLLVVGLVLTVGPGQEPDGDRLLLASAEGTSLVLPNGTVVVARSGMELAEGTLLVTSATGSARVNGVEVPPDRVAVVEDGRLRLLEVASTPATTTPSTTRPGDSVSPTSTPPTTTRPTSAPPTTASPAVTAPTSTTRPPSTTVTTAVATRPPVASLDLAATRPDRRRVALRWSAYPRDDFARYVVVRTLSDADGQPPDPGPSSTAVFSTTDRTARAVGDELPARAARAAYRVIVLDAQHRVVGASAVARV